MRDEKDNSGELDSPSSLILHPSSLLSPVTLEGRYVRLAPLSLEHTAALCEVGLDGELWKLTTMLVSTPEEMRRYIETALEDQASGMSLPFATIDKSSGQPVGSTRFGNIDRANRRVEIGWTWVAPAWQRTPVNTEAKYLMLNYAFESLGAIRVELKTDSLNERSRRAILRLGAKEEGTFRNHMITYTGRFRHSVYYSIIDSEWPLVKAALEEKLARPVHT
ncbi:MAG: GNAT family N-acetyltransferase [Acidobacteria bacterium]|nr:GNAT family N-acetyltransferase [Acidobacteriota bacterium]